MCLVGLIYIQGQFFLYGQEVGMYVWSRGRYVCMVKK